MYTKRSVLRVVNKIGKTTAILSFIIAFTVFYFEPTLTGAATDTDNVTVTLTVTEGISISDGANITMSPNISVSADSSIGSSTWTVTTNAASGYSLAVKASASPALVSGGNSFADYTEAVAGTPDTWSVDASEYEFGFSAFGTDVEAEHKGSGSSCGAGGTPDADLNYEGFATSDEIIATRASVTPTAGVTSTLCVAAEQNGVFAPSGTYTATITGTATTL